MSGYLVSGPRDAGQPESHLLGQATLHQPVAVAGQQERAQQDGEFSLRGRDSEGVSTNLSSPSQSLMSVTASRTLMGRLDQR